MPSIIPRQRVRGPSVAPAASSGSAIAQGLTQATGALLGQAADQRFEAEQFEIKQLEREQKGEALNATVQKATDRQQAIADIRNNFKATEWIEKTDEWEDQYDEAATKEQSPVFQESYLQQDRIGRINAISGMGTAMRADMLDKERAITISGVDEAVRTGNLDTLDMVISHARESGTLKTTAIDKMERDATKSIAENTLMSMDTNAAIAQMGEDNFLSEQFDPREKEDMIRTLNSKARRENDMAFIALTASTASARTELAAMGVSGASFQEAMKWVKDSELTPVQRKDAEDFVRQWWNDDKPVVTAQERAGNNTLHKGLMKEAIDEIKFDKTNEDLDPNNADSRESVVGHMNRLDKLLNNALVDHADGKIDLSTYNQIQLDANSMMKQMAGSMEGDSLSGNTTPARILSDDLEFAIKGMTAQEETMFKSYVLPKIMSSPDAYKGMPRDEAQFSVNRLVLEGRALIAASRNPGNTPEANEQTAEAMANTSPDKIAPRQQIQAGVNRIANTRQEAFDMAKDHGGLSDVESTLVADEWERTNEFTGPPVIDTRPAINSPLVQELKFGTGKK